MAYIATHWTQERAKEWAKESGETLEIEDMYEEEKCKRAIKALRLSENETKEELIGFIMLLFGNESRFSKEEYREQIIQPHCNWIFSAAGIRSRFKNF